MKSYTVRTIEEAWTIASDLFKGDYEFDTQASANAGYDIYMSTNKASNDHVSDLGCRLEVNIGIESINIWIEPEEEKEPEKENTNAVDIKVTFKKERGTVLKNRTAYTNESYIFYADEVDEATKAADAIIRFLKKNDACLYVRHYDHKNIPAGMKYTLFISSDMYRTTNGTCRTAHYTDGTPESYDLNGERHVSFSKAAELLREEIANLLYYGVSAF